MAILKEIHEGECGNHAASQALIGKVFQLGFYWTSALKDAEALVQRCESCQFHAKKIHQPAQALQNIPLSWPFAVWGLDILGPFPRAVGGYELLYVAIDKFTKWTEATPMAKVTTLTAIQFIRSILSRFGVPNHIITDNGTQFTSQTFTNYCHKLGISLCYGSVVHPRSNVRVERANGALQRGLKMRTFNKLEKHGRKWVDELPSALWAMQTAKSKATGETPFFLVYGAKAVIPTELVRSSQRVHAYQEED